MTMKAVPFKSFDTVPKMFTKKKCNEKIETIYQMKKRPECVKVTKNNCVTKWDYDQNGNQVSFSNLEVFWQIANSEVLWQNDTENVSQFRDFATDCIEI